MKFHLDRNSLKFKLWLYFVIFAMVLMGLLWCLQIIFINGYYQEMKISQTRKIARTLTAEFGTADFLEKVDLVKVNNDLIIEFSVGDKTVSFDSISADPTLPSTRMIYLPEMLQIKDKLRSTTADTISVVLKNEFTDNNTFAYGTYLQRGPGEDVCMYIVAPLRPLESTVGILASQLIYVTLISLLLAFILSFLISKKLTTPIIEITKSADRLAKRDYQVTFDGGQYTEISHLADTLNYTAKELTKAENLQKDLIANVSHDLRTPLTMVRSYAEMIRDISGDHPEKRVAHLQVIIDESERLSLLVNDLLEMSKMQSGTHDLYLSSFSLKDALDHTLQTYQVLCEREGYAFDVSYDRETSVIGDRRLIEQVLSNLISNAVRYGGEKKKISIKLGEKDGFVECHIQDWGDGIHQEELALIWDRYYKASTNHSRNQLSGTGLGLSIVKQILLLHQAKFGVESTIGQGSTFWFALPKST